MQRNTFTLTIELEHGTTPLAVAAALKNTARALSTIANCYGDKWVDMSTPLPVAGPVVGVGGHSIGKWEAK